MRKVGSNISSVSAGYNRIKKKKKTEIGGYTEQVVLHFGQIPDLLISMTILALSRSCHAEVESWRPQHMLI